MAGRAGERRLTGTCTVEKRGTLLGVEPAQQYNAKPNAQMPTFEVQNGV